MPSFFVKFSGAALGAVAGLGALQSAFAQEAIVLPGVVVQGATLERPRVAPTLQATAPAAGPSAPAQAGPPAAAPAGPGAPLPGDTASQPATIGGTFVSESGASVSVVTRHSASGIFFCSSFFCLFPLAEC